jgi:hypothetical protein
MRHGARFAPVAALALLGLLPASARGQGGALAGLVRDSAGAPVVATLVTAERLRPAGGAPGARAGASGASGAPGAPGAAGSRGGAAGPEALVRMAEADSLGRYRLAGLPPGRYAVRAERLGYAVARRTVEVGAGATVRADFTLTPAALDIAPVSVEVTRERQGFSSDAGVSSRRLAASDIRRLPGLAEPDVIRVVQVLPGVITTSDFSSAFHVRGGSADENLIQLDGFPVFNPFHLGGLFGVFNSDMVGGAELLAGGFPASYGGRVSSMLNVESDGGAAGAGFEGAGGVSLLASRLALGQDLPASAARALGLRRGRARISFRRSYFDALLKPVADFPYHLTDMQGYFEGWTPGGGRLTLTGYTGGDVLDFGHADPATFPLRLKMDWGNTMAGAHWTGPLGAGRVLDLRAGYSQFGATIRFPDYSDTRFDSHIRQGLLRADLHLPATRALALDLGVGGDRLSSGNVARSGGTSFRDDADAGRLASVYGQARWRSSRWLVEAGLRGDGWYPASTGATWLGSPRLAVKRFAAGGDVAFKIAAGRFTQIVQSTRNEELPIGIDLWQLAGARAPAVVSDQVQGGIETFRPAGWHMVLEAYDRRFRGVVAENEAADPNDPSQELIAGRGRSYGADLLVKRERGAVNGWLSASWLHATRTFPDVLSGTVPPPEITYPPIFDRRVDLELVLRYPLPRAIEGGLHASFGSGLPYTRPIAGYEIFDYSLLTSRHKRPDSPRDSAELAVVLGPRNGARYPAYVRVDASLRKTIRKHWGVLAPYLDVLNVTNRKNVLFYFYQYNRNPPTRSGVSMFPFLPSVGVEATF